jgi:cytoplasmic iron level regulating protein YaaA (DUF328/UPF0246 family)
VHEPLLLLPPSEGKCPGGRLGSVSVGGRAQQEAFETLSEVLLGLAESDPERLARLLHVRSSIAEGARDNILDLRRAKIRLLPAAERFTGVVWKHLDAVTLSSEQRQGVVIPTALFGLVRASDRIANFRLSIDTTLPGIGPLARFWRDAMTERLLTLSRGRTVINMLPQQYAAALDLERVRERRSVVNVRFVTHGGGRTVGHDAKAVKGAAARHVLDGHDLNTFEWNEWVTRRHDEGFDVVAPASMTKR